MLAGCGGEGLEVVLLPGYGGEGVTDDLVCVVAEGGAHDQDLRLVFGGYCGLRERVAEGDGFGVVGDAEPLCSGLGEYGSAEVGAVAVGVCLDDCHHGGIVACGLREQTVVGFEALL